MRVLHVVHTSLPFICGYSIRTDYILRNQAAMGVEPVVVSSAQHPNGGALREEIGGIPHRRTPAHEGRSLPGLREHRLMDALHRQVEAAVAEWQPALIHAHSPLLVGLPALKAARRAGIPCVYEVRDLWENASVDRGKFSEGSLQYRLAKGLETRVLKGADAVVTICEKLREELRSRARREDRLFVVGNGVDASGFAPGGGGEEMRARFGLQGKRLLGYVGTFQPYEGLDLLIAAMPEILARVPDAHLVITGSGGVEAALKAQVERAGLQKAVTFTGRLPHDEVNGIYAAADLLVYPRVLTRTTALTTPLKPLEAMAMAKPVLVSDVPAMLELVQPDRTGFLFPAGKVSVLAQQAAALLAKPERLRSAGLCAREWVLAHRQWSTLVAQYSGIYEAVLRQPLRVEARCTSTAS